MRIIFFLFLLVFSAGVFAQKIFTVEYQNQADLKIYFA